MEYIKSSHTMDNQDGGENTVSTYEQLFNKSVLSKKIGINVGELLRNSDKTINDIIEGKLRILYEGLCITAGYVKNDSIKLLSHSMGIMKNDEFEYNVVFECSICNPYAGMKLQCIVKNITKAGLRCEFAGVLESGKQKSPIVVFIPRDYYYADDSFNSIKETDTITAEIIGTRYELNDTYIVAFAGLVK